MALGGHTSTQIGLSQCIQAEETKYVCTLFNQAPIRARQEPPTTSTTRRHRTTNRQVVLVLASHLASFTAGTRPIFDIESISNGHLRLLEAFSICTIIVCWALPNANGVNLSEVNTFTAPRLSIPVSSGVHHAPVGISTTPGMIRIVTRQGRHISPLSLYTFTQSPSLMPRADASSSLMKTLWGKAYSSQSLLS